MIGYRRQVGCAATHDDGMAEQVQLVDETESDRRRGQGGATDLDVRAGRGDRRNLFGHRRLGEPGVTLDAFRAYG